MNLTYKVNIWELKTLKPGKDGRKRPKPYGVRWITAGREHSEWYRTKTLADRRRNKLISATEAGEPFDVESGLPKSEAEKAAARSLLRLAQEFINHEWEGAAPNTRKRNVDTLAIPVAAFVSSAKGAPDIATLRRTLTGYLLVPPNARNRELTTEEEAAARWIEAASRPVRELDKIETASLLRTLGRNLNGKPAADWTVRTRRGTLHNLLSYAVDVGELGFNPVVGSRAALQRGNSEVDPRVVLNPAQARNCLAGVTYAGGRPGRFDYLYGFFASMYYAGLRPCEVNRVREEDCKLPDSGWGELLLEKSASRAPSRYVDSGQTWEARNLKRRAQGTVRPVPIPPHLVVILREHIERFGVTSDGRLFRGLKNGDPVGASVYCDVWRKARLVGLSPQQARSPLGEDPYDLRHAAVSTWLTAGVSPAEVAERAGHTVEVLLKVYAKVLDGQREPSNRKIEGLLNDDG
ncbi:integrase [Actinosynnema sp. NPDC047251]|uniref:Integrase family protein n=1 Tax=Saccharothrix espanaensis (strain ATCC 51144 / DSM 44229 / JCM 9112 / NBRC 15066 / NRRL 15764) TaxID=1179773 RepID=K0K4N9_SACES|nr:integrase family protein [Saccharothrix espanaensis]CCH35230.1 Integrase family protein [Saccharothrix espanaensis DSM 44229]